MNTTEKRLTRDDVRAALRDEQMCLHVVRGDEAFTISYVFGGVQFVGAWRASDGFAEDIPAVVDFGGCSPFTGLATKETADAVLAWLFDDSPATGEG